MLVIQHCCWESLYQISIKNILSFEIWSSLGSEYSIVKLHNTCFKHKLHHPRRTFGSQDLSKSPNKQVSSFSQGVVVTLSQSMAFSLSWQLGNVEKKYIFVDVSRWWSVVINLRLRHWAEVSPMQGPPQARPLLASVHWLHNLTFFRIQSPPRTELLSSKLIQSSSWSQSGKWVKY